ncbi:MAG: hypothetical protein HY791_31240 [Deltaproteobacteria bacterium]|nr:hypothetical protein [Deltaproteobacteria bacterium]
MKTELEAAMNQHPHEQWVKAVRRVIHDLNNVSGTLKLSMYSFESNVSQIERATPESRPQVVRRALAAAEGVEDARNMLDDLIRCLDEAVRAKPHP